MPALVLVSQCIRDRSENSVAVKADIFVMLGLVPQPLDQRPGRRAGLWHLAST